MIPVQTTNTFNTFDFWRNRHNEMSNYYTTCTVTTDANTATQRTPGNAAIYGTMLANVHLTGNSSVNAYVNASAIYICNSTVNTQMHLPNTVMYDNTYFLAANGQWTYLPFYYSSNNYDGTNIKKIDEWPMAGYNAAEYVVSVKDRSPGTGGSNNYYSSKILVSHDTTNSYITEYGSFTTNAYMGVFTVGINGANVELWFTPAVANIFVKYVRTAI